VRQGEADRCKQVGVSKHLTKPIRRSALLDAMLAAIGARQRDDAATAGTEIEPRAAAPARILLAEDNPVNQRFAARLLEKAGHLVRIVANGRLAVEAFQRERFDVILMDVQMPEMDGFGASAAIRRLEGEAGEGRHIPIIALTAHAMKGDRERCLDAGMDGYVAKPIRASVLLAKIDELLPAGDSGEQPSHGPAPQARTDEAETPADEAPTEEPFDPAAALQRLEGDTALLAELAAMLPDVAAAGIDRIREALAAGDHQAVGEAAHSLKGALASLDARPAFESALGLETAAREGDIDGIQSSWRKLPSQIAALTAALAPYAETAATPS
jgi:two-component system sensor histidine kinase/response regulator